MRPECIPTTVYNLSLIGRLEKRLLAAPEPLSIARASGSDRRCTGVYESSHLFADELPCCEMEPGIFGDNDDAKLVVDARSGIRHLSFEYRLLPVLEEFSRVSESGRARLWRVLVG